ncbi:hypothetical protein A1Q1_07406 [Trichosporon asahii var. asahii CBS 2479]|uniref:F-box domain-containing protein n=1 Tax=Trichosporon asahii var. asahii (strain ATCC 90039 / CBS 2479 / JCM 2466 / KCTC 7840 / NBRC 103889/ NCYC 2677 / UAMH 7654) TaxID=1186058 RepID=J6F366_TRIAS|nr:hypothetical protein A1Q1_07406 [Trichosporon asahii var. asahii CBS 2479]EJT51434.1 hypothetical protein A1Q1_07406 [Trichosporon asahii var. asahii CBS 2479]
MTAIDHQYFPHIIDVIFDTAPPASLAVMARACREWRDCVLSRFHHVQDVRIEQVDGAIQTVFYIPTKSNEGVYYNHVGLTPNCLGLLAGCKILDITEDPSRRTIRELPNLDTVRYHFDWQAYTAISARQIVCAGHIYPIMEFDPTVKRLVIHSGGSSDYFYSNTYPDLCGLTSLEELVLLFEDVLSCLEDFDYTEDELAEYSDEDLSPDLDCPLWLLSTVEDVIHAGLEQGAKVLLVGTELWNTYAFGALKRGLMRTYDIELTSADDGVTLMTVDGYRELVGEKEWEIETNFGSVVFSP